MSDDRPGPRAPALIAADVERGRELRESIAAGIAELKQIEARLEADALGGEQIALEEKGREGRQFLARGRSAIVPIVITSDALVKEFTKDGDVHKTILAAAGEHFAKFFKPVHKFKTFFDDGLKFREKAREILGDAAPAFITACLSRDKDDIPKSKIVIAWDRAKPIPEGCASARPTSP